MRQVRDFFLGLDEERGERKHTILYIVEDRYTCNTFKLAFVPRKPGED